MAFFVLQSLARVSGESKNPTTVKLEIKCVPNSYVRAVRRTRVVAPKSNERSEFAHERGSFLTAPL